MVLTVRRAQRVERGANRADLDAAEAAVTGVQGATWLREDLLREYYAILDVISAYDARELTIKGWSVTLSLAGLGFAFERQSYGLFGVSALAAVAFWFLDALSKGYQLRYYARMRDIEYTAYLLNAVTVGGEFGDAPMSAPRIDLAWQASGRGLPSVSSQPPRRRSPEETRNSLRRCFWWPNVALPHAVAVLLGAGLLIAALLGVPALAGFHL